MILDIVYTLGQIGNYDISRIGLYEALYIIKKHDLIQRRAIAENNV